MAATITSITGLQNLTNLQRFDADYNSLTSVNLSGLTSLVSVDVSDNRAPGGGSKSLTSINLSGCTALEDLRLDDSDFSAGFPDLSGLTSLAFMDIDQSGITGSVDISNLPALEGADFNGNTGLTELIISSSQPIGDGRELLAYDCALTETAVDNILIALSENGVTGGYADLSGGTSAIPSATGIAAKAVLEGNGWSVNVN